MDEQTFWASLDRSGDCWEWTRKRLPKGYGRFSFNGRQTYAHRVAYELAVGPIPDGWLICHRCDNPPCARPDHLFAGTPTDNMRDMAAKGRRLMVFRLRDREPFGPLVVRSQRGVLHRAQPGPIVHPRCVGGRPFVGDVVTPEEAVEWATGHPAVLCRYPWCFRSTIAAAGLDPFVGHVVRDVYRQVGRRVKAEPRHKGTPTRDHEFVDGWAYCTCGEIIVKRTDGHNPDRSWWAHKSRTALRVAA